MTDHIVETRNARKQQAILHVETLRKSAVKDGAPKPEIEAIANIALLVLGCLIDIAEAAREEMKK